MHVHGRAGGAPLVLVHGLTDDGGCWPDAVTHWGGTWRILAVDQRGHGASPRFTPDQLPRSPEVWVDDLAEAVRTVGAPVVLVGHSLGGTNALRVASAHPELVRALVLEDPAKPSGARAPEPTFVAENLAMLDAVAADPAAEVARMRAETPWSEAELDAWAQAKLAVDREMIRRGLFLGDAAWEEVVDALTVPTLVVAPRGGEMVPDPAAIANPLVRFALLDGVGHCVRRDDPAAYFAVVDDFLSRHC